MSAVDDSLPSYLTGSEDWPLSMATCKLFKGLEFILLQIEGSSHSSTGCESMYLVVLLLVSVTASTYRVSAVALINKWLVAFCDDCCDGASPCPADPGLT